MKIYEAYCSRCTTSSTNAPENRTLVEEDGIITCTKCWHQIGIYEVADGIYSVGELDE